ncbi:MAG: hypothetical protein GX780_00530 [Campylobacteraceae bacterium]|nr:hypothetical protein [Campylobacteraceae bacterium]
MTNEAILTQLGYTVNSGALAQLEYAISNTPGFEHINKNLITLHDHLQPYLSFVALSSSKPYFKIKNMATEPKAKEEVKAVIQKWSEKFKVNIEKVDGKETYYVTGFEKS